MESAELNPEPEEATDHAVLLLDGAEVLRADLNGADVVTLVLYGRDVNGTLDPDKAGEEGTVAVYVLSAEDGMEVARRLKAVSATVKPMQKQLNNTEDK